MAQVCPRSGSHVWTKGFQVISEGTTYRVHQYDACAKCGQSRGRLPQPEVSELEADGDMHTHMRKCYVWNTRSVNVDTGPPSMGSYASLARSHRPWKVNLEGSC